MGCDLHFFVEQKFDDTWEQVSSNEGPYDEYMKQNEWYNYRNYSLFGLLAGVRKSFSKQIANEYSRLPENLSKVLRKSYDAGRDDYHTARCISLKELIDFPWEEAEIFVGYADVKQYRGLKNNPETYDHYSYDVNVSKESLIVSADQMEKIIDLYAFENEGIKYYTKISWKEKYKDIVGLKFMENIEAMKKLDFNVENVRIIFWFDN